MIMSGHFHPPITPSTYLIGGSVRPRACLDIVIRRQILPMPRTKPHSPSLWPVSLVNLYRLQKCTVNIIKSI